MDESKANTPISAYIESLSKAGAGVVAYLREGSSAPGETFETKVKGLMLPDEVKWLWRTFDGMNSEDTTLDQLWLEGCFYFFSEAEALDDFMITQRLWEEDEAFKDYWPQGFFPIATPGDGSRMLVDCSPQSETFGAVFELLHGVGVSALAPSLFDYFTLARKWLEENAIWIDEDGNVDRDFDRSDDIQQQMFPDAMY
ncbi:MAG: SMI1/KNR4 family protein [Alphaproteobacteria bacterium]|nr:hypothetical protein [Hyphomonas sp.]MBR9806936.1 SMI1/KNR4 family protein [Alphaproteobacteria bacterium]|tara:strand:- start:161 stop:754 length:594 start_codon:yes stop_codon:yes gene_type:complete